MSYQLLNPTCMYGERGHAPEWEAGEPVQCSNRRCMEIYDADDDTAQLHYLNGRYICRECVVMCDCGEYVDDDAPAWCGPVVTFRRWEMDGKLATMHATCAAEHVLMCFNDNGYLDVDASREEIAAVVMRELKLAA